MKNLLSFKLFESSRLNDVVKDIKDILLPMAQLDYTTDVSTKHFPSNQGTRQVKREVIKVNIRWGKKAHTINIDIIDVLHQLLSYAKAEGFNCHDIPYGDIKINIDNMQIVYTLKDLEALKSGKVYTVEITLIRDI